jgi:integral membrane sensor domain MASE1
LELLLAGALLEEALLELLLAAVLGPLLAGVLGPLLVGVLELSLESLTEECKA